MTYRLDQLPAQPFLSDEDQRQLIATVKSQVIFGRTDEVEAAEEALVMAFLPVIKRAAKLSRIQEPDDAFASVLEEFLLALRDFPTSSPTPFHAALSIRLRRAISDADASSRVVSIPEAPMDRYWRVMHAHGLDVEAAYRACKETTTQLSPMAFLAIHHVVSGTDSLSAVQVEPAAPGPEERVVEEHLIAWLFTLVDDRQESILRLIYGFLDEPTEELRFTAGYSTGLDLSDEQAAHALTMTRPTVQRQKKAALAIMRAAMTELVQEEEAV